MVVVTDLDATLLTSEYSWKEAESAVSRLQYLNFPLVFNSSKTAAEMKDLSEEMRNFSPMIAENGGAIAIPSTWPKQPQSRPLEYGITVHGIPRTKICKIAHELRVREGFQFEGFSDWTTEELQSRTGLNAVQARKAKDRAATEPIIWLDSDERWLHFKEELASHGVRVLRGGRFRHLMGNHDKSDGLSWVRELYVQKEPTTKWTIVALGDSQNDLRMIETADIGVVIPSQHGETLAPNGKRIVFAEYPGPKGWAKSINKILDDAMKDSSSHGEKTSK